MWREGDRAVSRCCCGHDAVEPIDALSSPKKQLTDLEELVTSVFDSAVTCHEVTLVVATYQLANVMGWFNNIRITCV